MGTGIATQPGVTVCQTCGSTIELGAPQMSLAQGYMCEACFLRDIGRVPSREAESPYIALAEALAAALDAREHETGLHSQRVACHTMVLARRFIDDAAALRQIYWGALLHDIGKIGIPDAILLKHGPLTPDEWGIMRRHPEIGYRILAAAPHLAEAARIVLAHEERFDGSGYPLGLVGAAIPFAARLFAVIDTLDAITSDRPYRAGLPFDSARQEIVRMSGIQFDPVAVQAFLAEETVLREMVTLKCGPAAVAEPRNGRKFERRKPDQTKPQVAAGPARK